MAAQRWRRWGALRWRGVMWPLMIPGLSVECYWPVKVW